MGIMKIFWIEDEINYQKDEHHPFNTAGFTLARKDAFKIIKCEVVELKVV